MFIAVHVGAGFHSEKKTPAYLRLCKRACKKAMKIMRSGGSAVEAIEEAISVLENDPMTNAGYGSNLTLEGTVECDASCMDSEKGFAAAGAVRGVKNPIALAAALLREENKGLLPLGRIPPIFMCGDGARTWAMEHGVETFNHRKKDLHVTEEQLGKYKKYKAALEKHARSSFVETGDSPPSKKRRRSDHPSDEKLMDTVGAICVDRLGHFAAGVSSGGIAMKYSGRIGEAAAHSAGCWATKRRELGAASSTTGAGEQIMKTSLARVCAELALETAGRGNGSEEEKEGDARDDETFDLSNVLRERFLDHPALETTEEKMAGVILLRIFDHQARQHHDDDDDRPSGPGHRTRGEFSCAHTTPSMGFGFMSDEDQSPTATMSRLPPGKDLALTVISI